MNNPAPVDAPPSDFTPLPLLADPGGYRACRWDLAQLPEERAYWLSLFRRHFEKLVACSLEESAERGVPPEVSGAKLTRARSLFFAWLDRAEANPADVAGPDGRLAILDICTTREDALRRFDIPDPYRLAKVEANAQAEPLYAGLVTHHDALADNDRGIAVLRGLFAGNIFDLGADETIKLFESGDAGFHAALRRLKPRPWLYDDADAWLERLRIDPPKQTLIFVDNAGPDIVLGAIPFARDLIQRGGRVVLTANPEPSLNDITHHELVEPGGLLDRLSIADPFLGKAITEGKLRCVPSGCRTPLIDLSKVSVELADEVQAHPPDLVVLIGMGRGIESNFDAVFTCPVLRTAMLKDLGVARGLGRPETAGVPARKAELFDLVLRYAEPDR
ncbi:MAG: ARMT1-like domain-containing protein [Planctomycetota bacterium]